MEPLPLAALALLTAGVGAVGGLGGALFLVPAMVLLGVPPTDAAPLGLLVVGASSLAAGPVLLRGGFVHQRLGVTLEVAASAAAVAGALVAPLLAHAFLVRVLGLSAALAAVLTLAQFGGRGVSFEPDDGGPVGEARGHLGGSYRLRGQVVRYRVRRLGSGLAAFAVAGGMAGLTGVGGGFLKTPVLHGVMDVPLRVAASTTLFINGITAAAGLATFALQGRVDVNSGAAVVAGGLIGGWGGAALQQRLNASGIARLVAALLAAVAVVLLVRA